MKKRLTIVNKIQYNIENEEKTMLNINLVCVGKIKENYLKEAMAEYAKRLSKYCHLEITELADEKLPSKLYNSIILEIKEKESCKIEKAIKTDSYVIALDLKGTEMSSEAFSQKIEQISVTGKSSITFIIGGTLGMTEKLLKTANETICFSQMTFPHQLIRVFLLEQIFRAFKISKNETYHW